MVSVKSLHINRLGDRPTEVNKRFSSDARLGVEWWQEAREAVYVVSITNYQELSTTLARQEPRAPSAKIFAGHLECRHVKKSGAVFEALDSQEYWNSAASFTALVGLNEIV